MVKLNNTYPMSGFVRDPKSHIKRLAETGRPEVLTVDGKATVVVQDVESYQRMLEALDLVDSVRIIRERLDSLNAGEPGVSADTVFKELLDMAEAKRSA
jgi:PHD/YefM family antitoxin component YafN of YafNO toxin-antitoxin module